MVVFWQANNFWNKVSKETINGNDIEKYIYSFEYLNIQNPVEYCKIKKIYNTDLICYFFEVEKYQTETDYREIFYQGFLDGNIDEKEYYIAENSFKKLINTLSNQSNIYVYYEFLATIENSYPFQSSNDIDFNFEFIKDNQGKFTKIVDKFQLEQIIVLFAREIVSGYILIDSIKSVLVCSGMHGYIFSVNELNSELLNNISLQTKIEKISTLNN